MPYVRFNNNIVYVYRYKLITCMIHGTLILSNHTIVQGNSGETSYTILILKFDFIKVKEKNISP